MNKKEELMYSIIVPIYNCEKYIENCVLHLLNQKPINNFEILLINDGSSDTSGIICEDLQKKDSRIKYFYKDNSGVSDTRNFGLKNANGKYILFCDADDYVDDGFIEKIDSLLEKNYDLINFGVYFDTLNKKNSKTSCLINYEKHEYLSRDVLRDDLINLWDASMLYNIINKVFKNELIKKYNIHFPSFNFGEDMDFCFQYLKVIETMYNTGECYYHYIRGRNGAATEIFRENFFDIRKDEFIRANSFFESWGIKKEEYYEASCRRFTDRILGCIENLFVAKKGFRYRYKRIKEILHDKYSVEAFKNTKKISLKNKIIRIPMKLKLVLPTYIEMKFVHFIKKSFPNLFNKLKNSR